MHLVTKSVKQAMTQALQEARQEDKLAGCADLLFEMCKLGSSQYDEEIQAFLQLAEQERAIEVTEILLREKRNTYETDEGIGFEPEVFTALQLAGERLGEGVAVTMVELYRALRAIGASGAELFGEGTEGLPPALVEEAQRAHERRLQRRQGDEFEEQHREGLLGKWGVDLTMLAHHGSLPPVVGREKKIDELILALSGKRKRSALLVGEAGVGKTAVVEGLAQRIADRAVPAEFWDTRVINLDAAQIMAGTKFHGSLEERMRDLIRELEENPQIILFLDEAHTIMSNERTLDIANLLKSALGRGRIRVIAATTPDEFTEHMEKDAAITRRFCKLAVEEPDEEALVEILENMEEYYNLAITVEAIEETIRLAPRFLPGKKNPDAVLDIMDRAAAIAYLGAEGDRWINGSRVYQAISSLCNMPLAYVAGNEMEKMAGLKEFLAGHIKGQEAALQKIGDAMITTVAGLADGAAAEDEKGPQAAMLFYGPTGVGKTKTAKWMAKYLFGEKNPPILIDCSEFSQDYTVSRLLGSPPGYVGYGDSTLLSKMRDNPYRLVLVDEIEKASPAFLRLFLQILEEGRLTDARGRSTSFANAVVIFTTNAGCGDTAPSHLGFGGEVDGAASAIKNASVYFPQEFLGRIQTHVVFERLDFMAYIEIVVNKLRQTNEQLEQRSLQLHVADGYWEDMARQAQASPFGARKLAEIYNQTVILPLSRFLTRQIATLPEGFALEEI